MITQRSFLNAKHAHFVLGISFIHHLSWCTTTRSIRKNFFNFSGLWLLSKCVKKHNVGFAGVAVKRYECNTTNGPVASCRCGPHITCKKTSIFLLFKHCLPSCWFSQGKQTLQGKPRWVGTYFMRRNILPSCVLNGKPMTQTHTKWKHH